MANARRKDKVNVTLWLPERYLHALETARRLAHEDRSKFIRIAIADRLKALGVPYDEEDLYAEDRARRPIFYPPVAGLAVELNEGASSAGEAMDDEAAANKTLKAAMDEGQLRRKAGAPSGKGGSPGEGAEHGSSGRRSHSRGRQK